MNKKRNKFWNLADFSQKMGAILKFFTSKIYRKSTFQQPEKKLKNIKKIFTGEQHWNIVKCSSWTTYIIGRRILNIKHCSCQRNFLYIQFNFAFFLNPNSQKHFISLFHFFANFFNFHRKKITRKIIRFGKCSIIHQWSIIDLRYHSTMQ